MSFQYELTLFCDGCGDFFEPTGVMRRRDLPSEKSIIEAQTDWKFIKDKQLGYKAYCPKCQEKNEEGAEIMIDYKKAEQAKRLLKESGVDYVLAYVNGEKCTAITTMHAADWQSIKKCVIDVMVKILKVSRRGGMMTYDAICELREMVLEATVIHIEREKKE